MFRAQLAMRGVDLDQVREAGSLLLLDSAETIEAISHGSSLRADRFARVIGTHLQRTRARSADGEVCVYGEMVAELWARGDHESALRLEQFWNTAAQEQTFSLLCAYPIQGFDRGAHTRVFRDICAAHAHVRPTERYAEADSAMRLVEVSRLQQRAQALEAEIGRRRELEEQLRSALDAADRANRVKSEFLATMSHELRTPLNAIAGYTDLLDLDVRGSLTAEQRAYVARIRTSQHYLMSLIEGLLHFAKLEAGRVEFDMQSIPVDVVCSELEVLIAPQLSEKRLSYDYAPGDPEWRINADPEKVNQILLNLLANAVKYTEPSGQIRVSAAAAADTVEIRVADTGVGIPLDQRARIFEPFVQVARRPTSPHEGVGLGLAISRELARRMGGDISVESTPGVGSTFTVALRRGY